VEELDVVVDLIKDVVAREKLVLVELAGNAVPLVFIVQPPCERLVGMAVADEDRVELDRLVQQGRQVLDQVVEQADTAQEG
jgi:hypothetical protein